MFFDPLLAVIVRLPKPVREIAMAYCDPGKVPDAFASSGKWWILTDKKYREMKLNLSGG
jgi:hypothetical protein